MPSRLGLGNSTKASARFEALLRVIVRLCCMFIVRLARRGLARGRLGVIVAMMASAGLPKINRPNHREQNDQNKGGKNQKPFTRSGFHFPPGRDYIFWLHNSAFCTQRDWSLATELVS